MDDEHLALVEGQDTVGLVMAYVPGKGLEECLHDYQDPQRLIPLLEQLTATLDHLHGLPEPVIHRDIKPANIRVTPDGEGRWCKDRIGT